MKFKKPRVYKLMVESDLLVQPLAMKLLGICVLLALLVASGYGCEERPNLSKRLKNGYVDVRLKDNNVYFTIHKTDGTSMQNVLVTKIPNKVTKETTVKNCVANDPLVSCIMSDDVPHTKIKVDPTKDVVEITREINHPEGIIKDCYQLTDDGTEWFGGPEIKYQQWPIQRVRYDDMPYVTTAIENMAIAERYWLSSRGIYLYVNEEAPLFIDQNNELDRHLCLVAKNKEPYHKRDKIEMRYEIGVFKDPKTAQRNVIAQHFGKPSNYPNLKMVEHPIWSTWAQYKMNIDENIVLKFAKEINENGFKNSQLEIDDKWENCYGSAEFDPYKFPDVPGLVKKLKAMGFDVTLWIHPFINEDCEDSFIEALEKGYFVKNAEGSVHGFWWQGKNGAGAIDFTNKEAVDWWVARLKKIEAMGIDSFKFDAGEMSWLPQVPILKNASKELQPGVYTTAYMSMLAERFNDRIEVRGAHRTQKLPIFVRFQDKDSRYTWNNGLPTLITTLIQMNLNGYVFVLPDMIGGNGYVGDSFELTALPPKDMFIRWLQCNVFMPSLQFSFVPWQYDHETIEISKKFTKLHADLTPKIKALMERAVATGEPINPPIWWIDPLNAHAHKVYDEFLFGEEYLVAPVIEENTYQRDIYLPAGKWRDGNTNQVYNGPTLIKDYPAPIDILPYFRKE